MAEYNQLQKLKIPSSFFLLLQISILILTDAVAFGHIQQMAYAILPLVLSIAIFSRLTIKRFGNSYILVFIAATAVIILRSISFIPEKPSPLYMPADPSKPLTCTGRIITSHRGRYSSKLTIEINSIEKKGLLSERPLAHAFCGKYFRAGSEIEFLGALEPLNISGDEDSSTKNLCRRGITLRAIIKRGCIREISQSPDKLKWQARTRIELNHSKYFKHDTASFLNALYTGNKSDISGEQIDLFKKAGVMHVLAASGLHISILAALPFFIAFVFRINKKLTALATLPVLFLYYYITDYPVSLLRATLMFLIFTVQTLSGTRRNSFNILFLSGIIILLIEPADLFSPGFQLSLGACLGIFLFYSRFLSVLSFMPAYLRQSVSISASAQLFVMPLLLIHFRELTITGVFTSVFEIPLTAFTVFTSLAVHALSFASESAASFAGLTADLIHSVNLKLLTYASYIPGHFSMDIYPLFFIIAACIPLYLPIARKEISIKVIAVCLIISMSTSWFRMNSLISKNRKEIFCIEDNEIKSLIIYSNRSCVITGRIGSREAGKKIVEILKRNPADQAFIAPYPPDWKNLSNYSFIIKNYTVSKCFMQCNVPFTSSSRYFFRLLEKEGIETVFRKQNKIMKKTETVSNSVDSKNDIQYIYAVLDESGKYNKMEEYSYHRCVISH